MASVIVPTNLGSLLTNPMQAMDAVFDGPELTSIETEAAIKGEMIIQLEGNCFLKLLPDERRELAFHGESGVETRHIDTAGRLTEYLVYTCCLPDDTRKMQFTVDNFISNSHQELEDYLQVFVTYLRDLEYRPAVFCEGTLIKPLSNSQVSMMSLPSSSIVIPSVPQRASSILLFDPTSCMQMDTDNLDDDHIEEDLLLIKTKSH
ncbi:MAG: hypothetical protein GKR77_06795 [Legionellales bacterium]|nr:hypothetical protein [Legionellales bacterium]